MTIPLICTQFCLVLPRNHPNYSRLHHICTHEIWHWKYNILSLVSTLKWSIPPLADKNFCHNTHLKLLKSFYEILAFEEKIQSFCDFIYLPNLWNLHHLRGSSNIWPSVIFATGLLFRVRLFYLLCTVLQK